MEMQTPYRHQRSESPPTTSILYLEDNSPQVDAIKQALSSTEDFPAFVHAVASREDYLSALRESSWDVILCDYQSGALTGEEAFAQARTNHPSTPTIIITSAPAEEKAVDMLKAGATDYILKHQIGKLILAIKRALEEVALRRTYLETQEKYRRIEQTANEGIVVAAPDGRLTFANLRMADMLGYSVEDILGKSSMDVADQDWYHMVFLKRDGNHEGNRIEGEFKFRRNDGSVLWTYYNGSPLVNERGDHFADFTMHTDFTARKQAEEALEQVLQRVEADLDAMRRLRDLGTRLMHDGNLEPLLTEIVDTAIAITGADFGNIQLLDSTSGALKIMAQRGFPQWWLDYWTSVAEGAGACGTALKLQERVIVEDIAQSPIFLGAPGLEIQQKAGVRSVQSTPLVSRSGRVLGMFSTHFRSVHRPDDRALGLLDLLSRQAADMIEWVRAEETLRTERARLSAILESIPEEVWYADTVRRLVQVNHSVFQRFDEQVGVGEQIEQVASHYEVYRGDGTPRPPEEAPPLRALGGEAIQEEEEIVKTPAAGELRHRLVSASPVRDSQGTIIGSVAVVRDITERKRAEEQLRESEARFHIMANSTPVMIWVANAQGETEMVNHAYEEFFGVTEAQLKSPNSWKMLVHPEDEASYNAAYMEAVRKESPFDAEGRVKHRSGQWRWVHSYGAPRFSTEGKFLGLVGSSADITEEKNVADALRASELNLRLMVNQASDAMMVVSATGTIEAVSALGMRTLGYEDGELVGRNIAEFAETFSRLNTILSIEGLRKKAPVPTTLTVRVQTKNGGLVWLSVTASFVSLGTTLEKYFVRFRKVDLPSVKGVSGKEHTHPTTLAASLLHWVDFSVEVKKGLVAASWPSLLAERESIERQLAQLNDDQEPRLALADTIIRAHLLPLLQHAGYLDDYKSLGENRDPKQWWYYLDQRE